jgi:hypothetical protein
MFTEFATIMTLLKKEIDSGHSQAYQSAYDILRQRASREDTGEFSALRLDALETLGRASEGWTQSEATWRSFS